SVALKATEIARPAEMPPEADVVGGDAAKPLVWTLPVGAGLLQVSGALDAWRYRDRGTSGFDAFWTTVLAGAADRALPAIQVELSSHAVRPGERVAIAATVRDAALTASNRQATVDATAVLDDSVPIRVWPERRGRLFATVTAPSTPGFH